MKNRKQWRVVVMETKTSRDGLLLEEIGFCNPWKKPDEVKIKKDRYEEWIQKGAKPSRTIETLVKSIKS